jgi:hypothetical protein
VGIFALRDIPVGEEITYDYQFEHSGLASAANAYRRAHLAKWFGRITVTVGTTAGPELDTVLLFR